MGGMSCITEEEVAFCAFAMDEHNKLVENHHGVTWEETIAAERQRTERVKEALTILSVSGRILGHEDVLFVEFALKERCDFLSEGHGTPWCTRPASDATKATRLMAKLRRLCGLPPAEQDEKSVDYVSDIDVEQFLSYC